MNQSLRQSQSSSTWAHLHLTRVIWCTEGTVSSLFHVHFFWERAQALFKVQSSSDIHFLCSGWELNTRSDSMVSWMREACWSIEYFRTQLTLSSQAALLWGMVHMPSMTYASCFRRGSFKPIVSRFHQLSLWCTQSSRGSGTQQTALNVASLGTRGQQSWKSVEKVFQVRHVCSELFSSLSKGSSKGSFFSR